MSRMGRIIGVIGPFQDRRPEQTEAAPGIQAAPKTVYLVKDVGCLYPGTSRAAGIIQELQPPEPKGEMLVAGTLLVRIKTHDAELDQERTFASSMNLLAKVAGQLAEEWSPHALGVCAFPDPFHANQTPYDDKTYAYRSQTKM